ncbi:MAG TPA: hypothetical protein VMD30_14485, partial [Tepidisphaeraceae bacterium]|nr:hypothetical protein [Tepidisphaeraceae bacterium]
LNPLDYRIQSANASFAKTIPDRPQRYQIESMLDGRIQFEVIIENEVFNIHHIQPLEDQLLLVCARSMYRSSNDFEKNGRVYTRDGKFSRDILLGDGIRAVQTTTDGLIWTSFFDEGVFGNYGWKTPIGASGLVAWDSGAKKVFEFEPSAGLDSISDCYALNVESEQDAWCYYYTEFPLVRLRRQKIDSIWNMPVRGSDAFAVSGDYALFRGSYKERDIYRLFELHASGEVRQVSEMEFLDQSGDKIVADRVVGRGSTIHVLSKGCLYRVDVADTLAS